MSGSSGFWTREVILKILICFRCIEPLKDTSVSKYYNYCIANLIVPAHNNLGGCFLRRQLWLLIINATPKPGHFWLFLVLHPLTNWTHVFKYDVLILLYLQKPTRRSLHIYNLNSSASSWTKNPANTFRWVYCELHHFVLTLYLLVFNCFYAEGIIVFSIM